MSSLSASSESEAEDIDISYSDKKITGPFSGENAHQTSKTAIIRQDGAVVVSNSRKRKVDNDVENVPASHRKVIKTREEQEPVYSSKAVEMIVINFCLPRRHGPPVFPQNMPLFKSGKSAAFCL
ncbi:uncharacterized protein LOC136026798 [Artemia franciscana]|uniref:uncharacterized protein LOC136026798 n=1 Tax=Artemia franciscana TaxID=6661 RepID=UPI0032DA8AD1